MSGSQPAPLPGLQSAHPRPADRFVGLDLDQLPSPCYVVDLAQVRKNGRLLADIQAAAGCKILLALKAFSTWNVFPQLRPFLAGTCASGRHEARLGFEEFGGEVHVFAPAYTTEDMDCLLAIADHISFNSLTQWELHRPRIQGHPRKIHCGFRINPRVQVAATELYDPSAPRSRFGILASEAPSSLPPGITGIHVHNLCEQTLQPLVQTLERVEAEFGHLLHQAQWLNLGGGHLLTRTDYPVNELIALVQRLKSTYGVEVYLEPGEAVVYYAGIVVGTVQDVLNRGADSVAVTDLSATCHMPDVLEMPYRPALWDSFEFGQTPYSYRLGGNTCLAGDVIGDFGFAAPLRAGQRIAFDNEAFYTLVKSTTFNGVPHPAIVTWDSDTRELRVVREFGYDDYKRRLS